MFPNRLKELRLAEGLTQAELGAKINLSARVVGFYEKGDRSPSLETLISFANFFDVSTDYLLGVSTNKNSNTKENLNIDRELFGKINSLSESDKAELSTFLDFLTYRAKI